MFIGYLFIWVEIKWKVWCIDFFWKISKSRLFLIDKNDVEFFSGKLLGKFEFDIWSIFGNDGLCFFFLRLEWFDLNYEKEDIRYVRY